jgi:Uma2 family endonuclease
MSETQFMVWAEPRDARYELVEGVAMMQAGATRDHERIAKQVFVALFSAVDATRFDVNKGDFGVRIRAGDKRGSILYPDVVVDRQSENGAERATETPVVIVEVLSQGTDYAHHVEKLGRYKARDSLMQYVVFEQTAPKAHVWIRTETGWPAEPDIVEGAAGKIAFPALDVTVRLAEAYWKPAPPPAAGQG